MFLVSALLGITPLLAGCASGPRLDDSHTTRKLQKMPSPTGPRKVVTIYQFRSVVPEVSAQAGTDMFATAVIKSGHFRVLERAQLSETVMREKALNAQGMTTGNAAEHKLIGAEYIFEGAITEANTKESETGLAGTVRGLGVETSGEQAEIGLDIRVLDSRTGEILDSVNVRRKVSAGGYSASGLGAFVQSFTNVDLQGADVAVDRGSREGVDKAFRECVEEAVYHLATRFGS